MKRNTGSKSSLAESRLGIYYAPSIESRSEKVFQVIAKSLRKGGSPIIELSNEHKGRARLKPLLPHGALKGSEFTSLYVGRIDYVFMAPKAIVRRSAFSRSQQKMPSLYRELPIGVCRESTNLSKCYFPLSIDRSRPAHF